MNLFIIVGHFNSLSTFWVFRFTNLVTGATRACLRRMLLDITWMVSSVFMIFVRRSLMKKPRSPFSIDSAGELSTIFTLMDKVSNWSWKKSLSIGGNIAITIPPRRSPKNALARQHTSSSMVSSTWARAIFFEEIGSCLASASRYHVCFSYSCRSSYLPGILSPSQHVLYVLPTFTGGHAPGQGQLKRFCGFFLLQRGFHIFDCRKHLGVKVGIVSLLHFYQQCP